MGSHTRCLQRHNSCMEVFHVWRHFGGLASLRHPKWHLMAMSAKIPAKHSQIMLNMRLTRILCQLQRLSSLDFCTISLPRMAPAKNGSNFSRRLRDSGHQIWGYRAGSFSVSFFGGFRALGTAPPRIPVSNKGLGWDFLLKAIQLSGWWVLLSEG